MNKNSPMPRWTSWLAAALIVLGYAALSAFETHTEALIAQADAQTAQAVAQTAQQYGIEGGKTVVVAEVQHERP